MELGSMLRMIDSRVWISDRRVAERTDEGTVIERSSKNNDMMKSKEEEERDDGCVLVAIVMVLS